MDRDFPEAIVVAVESKNQLAKGSNAVLVVDDSFVSILDRKIHVLGTICKCGMHASSFGQIRIQHSCRFWLLPKRVVASTSVLDDKLVCGPRTVFNALWNWSKST